MSTVLKSFRIDSKLISSLEEISEEMGISQSGVINTALVKLIEEAKQWSDDLVLMSSDEAYKNEQIALAEEFYEN